MPELDGVTRATPPGDEPFDMPIVLPDRWRCGDVTVFVEVNTEGDYGGPWTPVYCPTPTRPEGQWDSWAIGWGYPYRGQPSVLFAASPGGNAGTPIGHGALEGEDGDTHPLADGIVDDPTGAPGSGADRLRLQPDGTRLRVECEP